MATTRDQEVESTLIESVCTRVRERLDANDAARAEEFVQHGWQSGHTVVELVCDDMPFLVDSTTMELSGHGTGIHLLIHPVVRVRRDADGELVAVLPPDAPEEEGTRTESFMHVEIDRQSGAGELE